MWDFKVAPFPTGVLCVSSLTVDGQAAKALALKSAYPFQVKICPRTGPHDWTQCPFAHQGEKAKRRDLQQFTYSGIPCSDFEQVCLSSRRNKREVSGTWAIPVPLFVLSR